MNTCIYLEHWPSHFKQFSTIIIPKPNKQTYGNPKSFCPIILLNTLGKLIEKVITDRLQFHVVKNDFIYSSQLGGLKFKSTSDTGVALTHAITLAFDIAQFFLSLNHCLLTLSLKKADFDPRVISFFADFLIQRNTKYR